MARRNWVWMVGIMLPALFLLNANFAEAAYVADNNAAVSEIMNGLSNGGAGFGSTFTNQLGGLGKSLLSAAKFIAVIMTAAAGCMVCFGIQDSRTAFWNWILGIGLAINFGDLLLNLWSVETATAPAKIADYNLLLKSENDPSIDILSPFMRYYIGVIMQGAAAVTPYAINLALMLALIDGSIRLAFDLVGGDKVKFLVTTVLKVGFFIFLIHSWVGTNSNYQLMPALSSGFEAMGYTAGGAQDMITEYVKGNPDSNIEVQSNQIVTNALNFFNLFWESASQKNILTILVGLVCVIAAVIILFLTALEMFMVRIEFWTMALITIPLLAFGVIDKLKFLADKAIGAMFNLAIKIFVIAFLATMSVNILTGLVENAKSMSGSADFMGNISYFLQVLLYALILFFLTKKIPALVSGLLSGNPSLGGGDMKQLVSSAAKGAASAAAKGAGAAGMAYGGMKALSASAGPMQSWGSKDSLGANALSFAGAAGGKAMSMTGQAASTGMEAVKQHNPVYRGYQRGMSMFGNGKGKDSGSNAGSHEGKDNIREKTQSTSNAAKGSGNNATPVAKPFGGADSGQGDGERMGSGSGADLRKKENPSAPASPSMSNSSVNAQPSAVSGSAAGWNNGSGKFMSGSAARESVSDRTEATRKNTAAGAAAPSAQSNRENIGSNSLLGNNGRMPKPKENPGHRRD